MALTASGDSIAISEKYLDYAKTVVSKLSEKDLRVELDISSESVGKKIRNAETKNSLHARRR